MSVFTSYSSPAVTSGSYASDFGADTFGQPLDQVGTSYWGDYCSGQNLDWPADDGSWTAPVYSLEVRYRGAEPSLATPQKLSRRQQRPTVNLSPSGWNEQIRVFNKSQTVCQNRFTPLDTEDDEEDEGKEAEEESLPPWPEIFSALPLTRSQNEAKDCERPRKKSRKAAKKRKRGQATHSCKPDGGESLDSFIGVPGAACHVRADEAGKAETPSERLLNGAVLKDNVYDDKDKKDEDKDQEDEDEGYDKEDDDEGEEEDEADERKDDEGKEDDEDSKADEDKERGHEDEEGKGGEEGRGDEEAMKAERFAAEAFELHCLDKELQRMERRGTALDICPLEARYRAQPLDSVHQHEDQWFQVPGGITVDSGAAEHVIPSDMCSNYPLIEGDQHRLGVYYVAASGEELENEGERQLLMADHMGNPRQMTFQVTQVNKALGSVGKLCQSGQQVVFNPPGHPDGSYVRDLRSEVRTPLREEGGTYKMDAWVSPYRDAVALGFPRQAP